jgi:tetratricopeptide (TPR) repeat protein
LELLGQALILQRRYADAEPYLRQAIRLGDATNVIATAIARNDLALIYEYRNKREESMELLKSAIPAVPAGRIHARIIANLGVTECKLGLKREAVEHLFQALREMEMAVGPEHPDVAKILDAQAAVLKGTGKKGLAREAASRAATIRAAFPGETKVLGATVDWLDLK